MNDPFLSLLISSQITEVNACALHQLGASVLRGKNTVLAWMFVSLLCGREIGGNHLSCSNLN